MRVASSAFLPAPWPALTVKSALSAMTAVSALAVGPVAWAQTGSDDPTVEKEQHSPSAVSTGVAGLEVRFVGDYPVIAIPAASPPPAKGTSIYLTDNIGNAIVAKTVVVFSRPRGEGKGSLVTLVVVQPTGTILDATTRGIYRAWDADALLALPALPPAAAGITLDAPLTGTVSTEVRSARPLPVVLAGKAVSVVVPIGVPGYEVGDIVYLGERRPEGNVVFARAAVSALAQSTNGEPLRTANLLPLEPKDPSVELATSKAPLAWSREEARVTRDTWILSKSHSKNGELARELGLSEGGNDAPVAIKLPNPTVALEANVRLGTLTGLPVFLGIDLAPRQWRYGAVLSMFPLAKEPVAWKNLFGAGFEYARANEVSFRAVRGIDGAVAGHRATSSAMAAWIFLRPHFGVRWLNRVDLDLKIWKQETTTIRRTDVPDELMLTGSGPEAHLRLEFIPFSNVVTSVAWEAPFPQKVKAEQKTTSTSGQEIQLSSDGTVSRSGATIGIGFRQALGASLPAAVLDFSSGAWIGSYVVKGGGRTQEADTQVQPFLTLGLGLVQEASAPR